MLLHPQYFSQRTSSLAYNDLEAMQALLGYSVIQVGDCWVLSHPKWKTNVYPATIVSTAPLLTIKQVLQRVS